MESFEDYFVKLLLMAATFSLFFSFFSNEPNSWVTGVSIYFASALMTTITSLCDYAKESQFRTLATEINKEKALVLRGQYAVT